MADKTSISWCTSTWNPLRGTDGHWACTKVSPGCLNCYAELLNERFGGPAYRVGADTARLDADVLGQPLRWRRGREVFVCSMTDLFRDEHPDEWIAAVFAVMALAPQHRFQVLTKRDERMREVVSSLTAKRMADALAALAWDDDACCAVENIVNGWALPAGMETDKPRDGSRSRWPLPNVALGVSVEDEPRVGRIANLLATPAALRFVSAEPLLGALDLTPHLPESPEGETLDGPWLDYVIVGGESGSNARPCDVAWVRDIVRQCKTSGVAVHVKQIGARARIDPEGVLTPKALAAYRAKPGDVEFFIKTKHPKGGDPTEWPLDLRVRDHWPWPDALRALEAV